MSTVAQLADLANVWPQANWGAKINNTVAQAQLDAEEDDALSRLRARYSIPNPPPGPYSPKLIQSICEKARFKLIIIRGYNSANASDKMYEKAAEQADAWLDRVERQVIHPMIVESGVSPVNPAPMVVSRPGQGWAPPPVVVGTDLNGNPTSNSGTYNG